MYPSPIVAVLIHVSDWRAALAWYQSAFPRAKRVRIESHDFECLDDALDHFKGIGAALYRGPMQIEDNLWMCQVRDPWGNCIGLRGTEEA